MSTSHWMFCVIRPRLEVRLRNSAVDSSGSLPARSLARTSGRTTPGRGRRRRSGRAISQRLLSAARMPSDDQDQADGRQDRADRVEGAGRVRRQRVPDVAPAQHDDQPR